MRISNWALPGLECRHNLKYWTGVPYRGSVSARTRFRRTQVRNVSSLKEYGTSARDYTARLPISREAGKSDAHMLE